MNKEVFAWGMYDLANTIFSALFVTFFFPFFVKAFLGGNEFQIGLVFGISMLLVGFIVPFIGAVSDLLNYRMRFIIIFTVLCCVATVVVAFVPLLPALLLGGFANFCFHAALTTYNALLLHIAKKSERGRVSSIGVGMGYIGTLVSLVVAYLVLSQFGWESFVGMQAMFVTTAVLFLGLSCFTFFGIKEKRNHFVGVWRSAFADVKKTVLSLKRSVVFFLLSMFFYVNAIHAMIVFLYLFAREQIGLSIQEFFVVYAFLSVGAIIGSFAVGRIIDRVGALRVLFWSGFAWIGVIILFFFVKSVVTFTIVGMLGGAALGVVWSAQRPKLMSLVPEKNLGQFFGFMELTGKFGGVFGPVVFGWLVVVSGYSAALWSLIGFFVVGIVLLRFDEN